MEPGEIFDKIKKDVVVSDEKTKEKARRFIERYGVSGGKLSKEKTMEPNPKTVEEAVTKKILPSWATFITKGAETGRMKGRVKKLGWFKRWRLRRKEKKVEEKSVDQKKNTTIDGEKKKGILRRLFDPVKIAKRREFRVEVSGNRKWIMIGVAVVAVCGTIIYLSVTYGGGGFGNLIKMLGTFK